MWPGLMQRLLVLPAEVHSRFSLLCIWSVWCVGRKPVLCQWPGFFFVLFFFRLSVGFNKMLGCCVECWQCTANAWWCITKHLRFVFKLICHLSFYLLCSLLHLAVLFLSLLSQVFCLYLRVLPLICVSAAKICDAKSKQAMASCRW